MRVHGSQKQSFLVTFRSQTWEGKAMKRISFFENLESRRLFTVGYGIDVNGMIHVAGDGSANQITVHASAAHGEINLRLYDNGVYVTIIGTAGLSGLVVDGQDGNDIITLKGDGFAALPSSFYIEVNGNAGDDLLIGGAAEDHLNGGIGNDVMLGNAGDDQLVGDAGNDLASGGAGDDYIVLGSGCNIGRGDAGNDTFFVADDFIGQDIYDGGRGTDSFLYQTTPRPASVFHSIEIFDQVPIGAG